MATVRTLSVSLKARTAGFQAGMRRAQGSMAAFTKTVRLARNVLGGFVAFEVGRILARAFSSGSTAAASFERQMSKINVLLEENQKHLLPQMTRDIVNLSLEFGESTESLAAGMFKIISSQFEAADASFELLTKKILGNYKPSFDLIKYHVNVEKHASGNLVTEATVKLKVGEKVEHVVGEGDGPVNALDSALRKSLENFYPMIKDVHLIDYKVRVVNARAGTAARVRVIIESRDKNSMWGTVGVSENIIEASWQALVDSMEYKLQKDIR